MGHALDSKMILEGRCCVPKLNEGCVRTCVAYTVVSQGPISDEYASRFVATWHEYPPGADTDLFIVCNGGPLPLALSLVLSPLNPQMFPRVNDEGRDLTGYLDAVRGPCKDYDAILCLGESIYFTREGWLNRLVNAWSKYGPGFYGPFGSNNVSPHLQTSAFFCPPALLRRYPVRPLTRTARMEFEYGTHSMWRRTAAWGMPVRCVTWDGEWEPRHWRMGKNILWRGNQSNLLMMNNHAQGWENESPGTKQKWSAQADTPFR